VWYINPDIHASISLIEGDKLWQTMTMWFGHPRIAVITWVLTHLVFFVFIFGLAILNKKFKYLWYFILILSAVNAIDKAFIGSQLFGRGDSMLYLIFSPHNLEFAFGAFAYYLFESGYKIQRYRLLLAFAIVFFFFIGSLYAYTDLDYHDHRVFAFGLTALLLVIAVVNYGKFKPAPANNIFYKLGEAEYIMLLFHGPILSIVDFNLATKVSFGWAISLTTIFIILTISYFIRTRMEEPLLAYVNRKLLGKAD
jgi:peptidoglycan/LPS O-acetylase OafA/YrhL